MPLECKPSDGWIFCHARTLRVYFKKKKVLREKLYLRNHCKLRNKWDHFGKQIINKICDKQENVDLTVDPLSPWRHKSNMQSTVHLLDSLPKPSTPPAYLPYWSKGAYIYDVHTNPPKIRPPSLPHPQTSANRRNMDPPPKLRIWTSTFWPFIPPPSPSKMLWMTGLSWLKVDILLPYNAIRYGEILSICNKPVLVNFDHFLEFEFKNSCGRPHFTGWPPSLPPSTISHHPQFQARFSDPPPPLPCGRHICMIPYLDSRRGSFVSQLATHNSCWEMTQRSQKVEFLHNWAKIWVYCANWYEAWQADVFISSSYKNVMQEFWTFLAVQLAEKSKTSQFP